MSETLFIRLGSRAEDKIHWLILASASQEIIASGELACASELTELTEKAQSRPVTILAPSCDVALKSLTVPGNSNRAIKLAAPYMLEDDLAQDVDDLFFAYHNLPKDELGHNCFVAAVDRKQLELWLSWLEQADIHSKTMIPDVLALPLTEEAITTVVLGQQVLVRESLWQGQAIDEDAWPLVSKFWQESEDTKIFAAFSPLPLNEDCQLEVNNQPAELPMALLAKNANKQSFNLLQAEFQVKKAHSVALTHWLWVAGIAAFALCLQVGIKAGQLWQLTAQQGKVEQEIITTYKDTFPSSKRVRINTIRPLVKQKLGEVVQSTDGEGFMFLLAKLKPAFANVPELRPQTLKFDGKRNEIRIQAVGKDYQSFERFKIELEKAGLTVSQGSQSNQGDKVAGSFSIKG